MGQYTDQFRRGLIAISMSMIAACSGGNGSTYDAVTQSMQEWPPYQSGENPPAAPSELEPIISNLDALAEVLPDEVVTQLFDPVAFGVTVRDLTDPALVAFQVRATLAQLQDGSRVDHAYHWYGHPDYNDKVAIVPVEFNNRYGTRLYGEIVLPQRGEVAPSQGPFPAVVVLEGLNTNLAMYRWWHQAFADAGYIVFAFDFSGQGHSDNEGAEDPGNNIEEAQDALTYLLEESPVRSVVDSSRLGVIGHSQGAIATMGVQAVEARFSAAVAAAPISEDMASFDTNPIPVMIQTGDHDGPVAPIPFINPAVVRPVYDKLTEDRAFIVAEAASHAQHTNYPLLPTASWGLEIAAIYSVEWMNYHFYGAEESYVALTTAHPHLSYLWESEVRIGNEVTVMTGGGPVLENGH